MIRRQEGRNVAAEMFVLYQQGVIVDQQLLKSGKTLIYFSGLLIFTIIS